SRHDVFATFPAHGLGRHTRYRAARGHVVEHDRARGDARVLAHLDISQHLGAGADHHTAAYLRMAVAGLLARAAERHRMPHGDVILPHGGFADDNAVGVIDEYARTDLGRGMDVDGEQF